MGAEKAYPQKIVSIKKITISPLPIPLFLDVPFGDANWKTVNKVRDIQISKFVGRRTHANPASIRLILRLF